MMALGTIAQSVFRSDRVTGVIISSLLAILFGYCLRKKGVLTTDTPKVLMKVILAISLPSLAFKAFMKDINQESLAQGINLLIWGFVIYILLILMTKLIYFKYDEDKQLILRVLTVFGSTTFFGIPIIAVVYGAEGVMYASIFNIAYRVFLYSYGYIKIAGLKMDKENIKLILFNPIFLATFGGMFIWVYQASFPQIMVGGHNYAFLRIDKTVVWLYILITYLGDLCPPLAWISIGSKLAEVSLKGIFTSVDSWFCSLVKVILVPLFNIIALYFLTITGILPVSFVALATVVIMMAVPTSTVAAAYAIGFDKGALLTSNSSLLSIVMCIVCMPLWILVLEIIKSLNVFV